MDHKKIRAMGAGALIIVWGLLTAFAWFGPKENASVAERRPLAQLPEISVQSLLDGKFMTDFEEYTLDQFPLRDSFRQLKSLFHYYALNQSDNNDIYMADGYAAKLDHPLRKPSVDHALERFNAIYEKYLAGSNVFVSVVPDKGYYLAEANGYPAMDYAELFRQVEEGMPWATFVDITDCLSITDYYYTDTHWRQEKLLDAAGRLCEALDVTAPRQEDYTQVQLERPFYGVYYGQAALPMDPEPMYILESQLLSGCAVYNHETGKTTPVYDMEKLQGEDLYDVYLSGAQALLTIENPNAKDDRELIVFRDSFGSAMIPLLLKDYRTVTVIDIRYISSDMLAEYVQFEGQDVLFLYSTLVLNNSSTLK